jgi:hypothetical protein
MKISSLIAGAVLALSLAGCGGGGGGGSSARGIRITPAGAAYFIEDGRVVVGVPSNAVSTTMVVTYEVPTSLPSDPNYIPGTAISFGNATFAKPVALQLHFSPSSLSSGVQAGDLVVVQLVDGNWVPLPNSRVDATANAVNVDVTSFGTFGIHTKPAG